MIELNQFETDSIMTKTKIRNLIVTLLTLTVASCATLNPASTDTSSKTNYLPESFTTENIMKLHEGMTSQEILKLFGNPKNISQAVCGGESPWSCTTWEYGKFPYDRASFTFNSGREPALLNSFSVDRQGQSLPATFTTENTMKIKQGMSSKKILEIFGNPVNVKQAVCGSAGELWLCTTWEYGQFPYDRASFTFSGKHKSLVLNDFSIDKD